MHCLHNSYCSLQYAILLVMIGSSISEHHQKQTLNYAEELGILCFAVRC